jgi:hypothetical protein
MYEEYDLKNKDRKLQYNCIVGSEFNKDTGILEEFALLYWYYRDNEGKIKETFPQNTLKIPLEVLNNFNEDMQVRAKKYYPKSIILNKDVFGYLKGTEVFLISPSMSKDFLILTLAERNDDRVFINIKQFPYKDLYNSPEKDFMNENKQFFNIV